MRRLAAAIAGLLILTAPAHRAAGEAPLTVRITSPLGRTGMHGAIDSWRK